MNKDGEWEEWTEEEDYGLAIEAMRAKKEWNYRRRLAEGESSEPELLEDDEQEQSQDGQSQRRQLQQPSLTHFVVRTAKRRVAQRPGPRPS